MERLSPQQIAAITILALPNRAGLTYEQVAEEVGVTRMTLSRWRKNDVFNKEFKRTIMNSTLDRMPEIMASIPDHIIKNGNAAMYRTFMQAHGLLTDRVEVENRDTQGPQEVDIEDVMRRIGMLKENRSK